VQAVVLLFPGSNRERDMCQALARATGKLPVVVWHRERALPKADLIVIPGGFSYGDYLRAGAMAAHSPILRAVTDAVARGVPVLGVCNGFQILCEAGLLPGVLMRNAGLKFVCKDVHMRVETSQSIFTAAYATGQVLRVPVAHHDGNYFADPDTLAALEDQGQIALRYCGPDGKPGPSTNPNGSVADIAGVFNKAKTVLGLMPHPENATDPALGGADGLALFTGLDAALAA